MTKFTLQYWKDSDWYVGILKENPSVFSQGRTLAELGANIQEVYRLMIEESQEVLPTRKYQTMDVAIST